MTDEKTPPPTPQDLKARMSSAFDDFIGACNALTPEKWQQSNACGEWSAKNIVDHLTAWQKESLTILESLLEGTSNVFDYDIDSFNAASVKDLENLSWQESLEDFEASYRAFEQALSQVTEAQYRTNKGFTAWIKAMIHEYEFHLPHIQAALDR
jgi:uncharacterized damage-inducible protein DinB